MSDSLDKLMFSDAGVRKRDLIDYYSAVANVMSTHLYDRCLTLQRFPDGIDEDGFYQQRRSDYFPKRVGSRKLPTANRTETIDHIVLNTRDGLVYLADQATIAFHGWLSRSDRPDHPDKLVFDLDPSGSDGTFRLLVECARSIRDTLDRHGLAAYVMTTGSRGLHVVSPLDRSTSFDDVRAFARGAGREVVEKSPERYTIEQRKRARKGRLYIDTTRNAYGQTAIVPYSLRALAAAPVATPLDWDELGRGDMGPRRYHIGNIRRRLAQKKDPWRDFFAHAARPNR